MTGQLPHHRRAGTGGSLAEKSASSLWKVVCHSGSRNISHASIVALPVLGPLFYGRSSIMSNALAGPGVR